MSTRKSAKLNSESPTSQDSNSNHSTATTSASASSISAAAVTTASIRPETPTTTAATAPTLATIGTVGSESVASLTSTPASSTKSTTSSAGGKATSGSDSAPGTPTSKDSFGVLPDTKRRRRPNSVLAVSTTPTGTPKKDSENDDATSVSMEDETEEEKMLPVEGIKKESAESVSDSPKARPRKVYNARSSMVTRNKATTNDATAKTTTTPPVEKRLSLPSDTGRTLRGNRRNTIGKTENIKDGMKKRPGRKPAAVLAALALAAESSPSAATNKRKRSDSTKSEDKEDDKIPIKSIKIEKEDFGDEKVETKTDEDLKTLGKENDDTIQRPMETTMATTTSPEKENAESTVTEDMETEDMLDTNEIKLELLEGTVEEEKLQSVEEDIVPLEVIASTSEKDCPVQTDDSEEKKKVPVEKLPDATPMDEDTSAKSTPSGSTSSMDSPKTPLGYNLPKRGRPKRTNSPPPVLPPIERPRRRSQIKNKEDPKKFSIIVASAPAAEDSSKGAKKSTTTPEVSSSDIGISPLSVDTATLPPALVTSQEATGSTSAGTTQNSEKAASLSPELISEGVSETSVKQFYKKPEFLENNLGIEKDPKLGEIVQKAEKVEDTVEKPPTEIDVISSPASSLKEGELRLDDSADDENFKEAKIDLESEDSAKEPAVDSTVEKCDKIIGTEADVVVDGGSEGDVKDDCVINQDKSLEEIHPANESNSDVDCITKAIVENGDSSVSFINAENSLMDVDSGVSDVTETSSKKIVENDSKETNGLNVCVNNDVETKRELIEDEEDDEMTENKENIEKTGDNVENSTAEGAKIIENNLTIPQDKKKLQETPETLKQKENHLKSLGLLTHKAAGEAKIQKQLWREMHQNSNGKKSSMSGNASTSSTSSSSSSTSTTLLASSGMTTGAGNKNSHEYTGTLKTVIKLNRQAGGNGSGNGNGNGSGEKRKGSGGSAAVASGSGGNGGGAGGGGRLPLKMTFQKGRGRGAASSDKDTNLPINMGEDTYYTIQNETDAGNNLESATGHGRKSHYRTHTSESVQPPEATPDKKEEKEAIVIPEKASSFSIHPGRVCQDQCYYCGGRFGLYDTPCHVAQIKSLERQQKILEKEKLTVDNCLCDACFRHVDRRANCPYKKRSSTNADGSDQGSPENDEEKAGPSHTHHANRSICFVPECNGRATHSMRRKYLRKTIKKLLPSDCGTPNLSPMVPICDKHYEIISQQMECALCKRRLVRNHMFHITQDIQRLEKLLSLQGLPVTLRDNAAVCKLCRYFTNLVIKPPDGKTQRAQFVKNYRRRLLHFHNINSGSDKDDGDQNDEDDEEEEEEIPQPPRPQPAKRGRKPKKRDNAEVNQANSRDQSHTPQSSEEGGNSSTTASGQIVLDNDVMVDYDVPMIRDSPSPPLMPLPSKLQSILQGSSSKKDDISIVLRSNPNISMRELFPGEEEMGLQMNIPFGNSGSQRTPEGWTRVKTFLQYDEPTRRLWEQLQKPYGNQSSFLRHLILLEKYFRNGDLILTHNASSGASVYADSVQTRLRSYDNINETTTTSKSSGSAAGSKNHNRNSNSGTKAANTSGGSNSGNSGRPSVNQLLQQSQRMQQNFTNSPITITARPKQQQHIIQNPSTSIGNSNSNTMFNSSSDNSILKSNLLGKGNSSIEILPINSNDNNKDGNGNGSNSGQMTKQQKILAAANRLINNEETSGSSMDQGKSGPDHSGRKGLGQNSGLPPELISINRGQNSLLLPKAKPTNHGMMPKFNPQHIIKLPETLTPSERMNSKHWRPTLMSVNGNAHHNQGGPLYQTADGRKLPALVQVQSGGRPYLISIHDYNRMCILRREKLLREQMLKGGNRNFGPGNRHNSMQQDKNNKLQIPNKILEQNSLIPVGIASKANENRRNDALRRSQGANVSALATKTTQHGQIQIIPHTIVSSQQQSLLQAGPSSASGSNAIAITQQPSASTNNYPSMLPTVLSLTPQTTATTTSAAWLWNSIGDAGNQMNGANKNFATSTSTSLSSAGFPTSIASSTNKQVAASAASSLVLDSNLLSKIPKSLTVIPQQKSQVSGQNSGRSGNRVNSIEDLT